MASQAGSQGWVTGSQHIGCCDLVTLRIRKVTRATCDLL